jgi:hypothetical protein
MLDPSLHVLDRTTAVQLQLSASVMVAAARRLRPE